MKHVVIIAGYPGSGKTTLAKEINSQLDIPLFDKDNYLEDSDFNNGNFIDIDTEAYRETILDALSDVRNTTMVVAPFIKQRLIKDYIATIVNTKNVRILFIDLKCSKKLNKQRIESRGYKRDTLKLTDFNNYYDTINLTTPSWSELDNYIQLSVDMFKDTYSIFKHLEDRLILFKEDV